MSGIRFSCLLVLLTVPVVRAQVPDRALEEVSWHVRVEPEAVRPGGAARLVFQARMEESEDGPWKMYAVGSPRPSRAVNITLQTVPAGIQPPDSILQQGAKSGFDPWFDTTVVYFEHQALLWADIGVGRDMPEGLQELQGDIVFMVCNDRICLPPAAMSFEAVVKVERSARGGQLSKPPRFIPSLFSDHARKLRPEPR